MAQSGVTLARQVFISLLPGDGLNLQVFFLCQSRSQYLTTARYAFVPLCLYWLCHHVTVGGVNAVN